MSDNSRLPVRRRTSGIVARPVGDDLLVLDVDKNAIHQFNPTARLIWERCDDCSSARELALLLVERFEVESGVAVRDAESMLERLEALGLLERA